MAQAYIGTSGWVYPWWREIFYPKGLPQGEWLGFFIAHFQTVEINASFYRLPKIETVRQWREAAPPGFVYAVKASRLITHLKRLKPDERSLKLFLDTARELGPALGPVLYQLPPNMKKNAALLEAFAKRLAPDLTHVFEFRNAEWFTPEVQGILEQYGLNFCIHDHHSMLVPDWMTGSIAYWRFHGRSGEPGGCYGRQALRPSARKIRAQIAAGHDVYVYFNNDAEGCAIRDAQMLMALVKARSKTGTDRRGSARQSEKTFVSEN